MNVVTLTITQCVQCPYCIQVWNTRACRHTDARPYTEDGFPWPKARRIPQIKRRITPIWPIPDWCPLLARLAEQEKKNET